MPFYKVTNQSNLLLAKLHSNSWLLHQQWPEPDRIQHFFLQSDTHNTIVLQFHTSSSFELENWRIFIDWLPPGLSAISTSAASLFSSPSEAEIIFCWSGCCCCFFFSGSEAAMAATWASQRSRRNAARSWPRASSASAAAGRSREAGGRRRRVGTAAGRGGATTPRRRWGRRRRRWRAAATTAPTAARAPPRRWAPHHVAGAQLSSGSSEIQQKERLEICQDFVGFNQENGEEMELRIEEEHEEFGGRWVEEVIIGMIKCQTLQMEHH